MVNKIQQAKRCSKCRKLIRIQNRSGLCNFHFRQEYYLKKQDLKEKRQKKNETKFSNVKGAI